MPYRRKPKTQARKKRRQAKPMLKAYNRRTRVVVPRNIARKGPFPIRMNTSLIYKGPSTTITSGGIFNYNACTFKLNDMFDFDYNNIVGNKQPLFYDQVLSQDGPYKYYKVNAWKTTIRFINLSDKAMFVYYDPCTALITESDTPTEIQNRRGVQSFMLTAQGNAKPSCVISKYQSLKSFFPKSVNSSENFAAGYNASPSTFAYSNLLWQTMDGSVTPYTIAFQIQHTFFCTLYNADSIIS